MKKMARPGCSLASGRLWCNEEKKRDEAMCERVRARWTDGEEIILLSGACFACTIRNPKLTSHSDGGSGVSCVRSRTSKMDRERRRRSREQHQHHYSTMPCDLISACLF
jgi:hypothetical protein